MSSSDSGARAASKPAVDQASVQTRVAAMRETLARALPHLLASTEAPPMAPPLSLADAALAVQQSGTQFGVLTQSAR